MRKILSFVVLGFLFSTCFALGDSIVPMGKGYHTLGPQQTISFIVPPSSAYHHIVCDYYSNVKPPLDLSFHISSGNLQDKYLNVGSYGANNMYYHTLEVGKILYINDNEEAHLYIKNVGINNNLLYVECYIY